MHEVAAEAIEVVELFLEALLLLSGTSENFSDAAFERVCESRLLLPQDGFDSGDMPKELFDSFSFKCFGKKAESGVHKPPCWLGPLDETQPRRKLPKIIFEFVCRGFVEVESVTGAVRGLLSLVIVLRITCQFLCRRRSPWNLQP